MTRLRRFAIGLIKARGLAVAETMRRLARNPRRVLDFLKMTANACPPGRARLSAPAGCLHRLATHPRHTRGPPLTPAGRRTPPRTTTPIAIGRPIPVKSVAGRAKGQQ